MRMLRGKKPSPALIVAIAALCAALAGTAVAGPIANDSRLSRADAKQVIKLARTIALRFDARFTAPIANNQITKREPDLSVKSAKSADSANSADTANTANSADTADSANTADSAENLNGQVSFLTRLGGGQSETIATNGPVSLVAQCLINEGGEDIVRILAQSTVNGSTMGGFDNFTGNGGEFLNAGTPASERILVSSQIATGATFVRNTIDQGFVMASDGSAIVANAEGIVLSLNYAGSPCIVAGVANSIG